MAVTQNTLVIALGRGLDDDADHCARLTQRLRAELLDVDIDSIEMATDGTAPPGTKAADAVIVGEFVVLLGFQRHVLRAVVDTAAGWLARQEPCSVKLSIDGDVLELTGVSSKELHELVEQWLERHTPAG